MSGVVGYINKTGKVSSALLNSMSESIRFTETDRINKWNDDFIAISIVHHSITNPQPQPIFNEDRSMCITMVGEVFDHEQEKLKLIHNGHKFNFEDNDAEYCLHLYEEKRETAFKELNGSFCIAIYNLATHELLLVTDRFSSYPLFYHLSNKNTLLFGTQLSSILQSSDAPRELNASAIFEFFNFMLVLGSKTFYKDINVLPPSTILHYRNGNISFFRYWEMRYNEEKHPEEYYIDKLAAAIKKSVKRTTQGNARPGVLLSGGLDSRMIVAASDTEMVCFTFGDFENREVKTARRIAEVKGYRHIFLKRNTDHYVNLVDKAVEIGDGMYGFLHAHGIGFFDQIRKECDVLLHGYATERFFRGTFLPRKELTFLGNTFLVTLDKLSYEDLSRKIIDKAKISMHRLNPKQLFVSPYSSIFDSVLLDSVNAILSEAESNCENIYDKFLWFYTRYAQGFAFLFRTSIRSFIDERSIAFDNNLIDLHLKMPVNLRSNNRIWKKVLKKLNPQIAQIPDANTGYSPFMPEFVASGLNVSRQIARKVHLLRSHQLPDPMYTQGSWPNFFLLTRRNERMKTLIIDTVRDSAAIDPHIFDLKRIEQMFKDYLNGRDEYLVFLFLLLTFGTWHKKYGPGNINHNVRM